MPQYAILVYLPEREDGTPDFSPEFAERFGDGRQAYERFQAQVKELGGTIVYELGLQPTPAATSIRNDVVTDGPFIETKEVLGGLTVIEARDLDHALSIAKALPAPIGVEVRPVFQE